MANSRRLLSSAKTVLYRRPQNELKRLWRWGPIAYFRCSAWQQQMEKAAERLQNLNFGGEEGKPLEVWFLTGSRFWYQTAFCAWSLALHSKRELTLNVIDDGSLEHGQERHLRRLFPKGVTRWKDELEPLLNAYLPRERFPVIRQRWSDYINIRKLTDIHLASSGAKLVLDSDMLFFKKPDELIAWWENPTEPCLMIDCEESYGYSRKLMESLVGDTIPTMLNVGICGLNSDWIDWAELEWWCRNLVEREGTSYYLEQALVAMIAARRRPTIMTKQDYITYPTYQQTLNRSGILQHYVSDSKPWYFRHAWRCLCRDVQ